MSLDSLSKLILRCKIDLDTYDCFQIELILSSKLFISRNQKLKFLIIELVFTRGVRGAVWFGSEAKSHLNRKINKYAV